ncbi:hypothetical protein [Massilia cavernae]|nr:hypothetical protein [Massilia cavernae]
MARIKPVSSILFTAVLAIPSVGLAEPVRDDCVRGEPVPVFAPTKSGLRSYQFRSPAGEGARELGSLGPGESLEIRHGGCEYLVMTIRFTSRKLRRQDVSGANAYPLAAGVLQRMHKLKAQSPYDLVLAAKTLIDASRRRSHPDFGESLPVDGDGIDFLQTQIQIDKAGLSHGFGFVEFSLFKGPL